MPRIARIPAPFCVRHLMVRFVNGESRFDHVPSARQEYLRRLGLALKKCDWSLLAFAFMGNHGHLVLLAGNDPPSKLMKPLDTGFAGWWNCQMRKRGYPYNRTRGPVFADRFADVIVPLERTGLVIAYIHNNPVRARVVVSPEMSAWTSHRMFLGLDAPLHFLDLNIALTLCGFDDSERGRAEFHNLVLGRLNDPKDGSLSSEYAMEQRERIRASLKIPAELATGYTSEQGVQFNIAPQSLATQDVRYNGSPELALQRVAASLGIAPQQMQSRCRNRTIAHGRAVLVQTWVTLGRPITEMAPIIGISHQAAYQLTQKSIDSQLIKDLAKTIRLI